MKKKADKEEIKLVIYTPVVEKVWEPGNLVPRKYFNLAERKLRFELMLYIYLVYWFISILRAEFLQIF